MKKRILTFIGLLVASVGIVALSQSAPVYATGEKYVWITPIQIEGTGGSLSGLGKPLVFHRQSNGTYRSDSLGGNVPMFSVTCPSITWTLTVGADGTSAGLTAVALGPTATCTESALQGIGYDKNVKIGNPANAPPMEGQDVDYRTVNCSAYYEGGNAVKRCEAVKACVVNHSLAVLDCLRSWHTCTINNPANTQLCVDTVTAGKLADAVKGGTTPPGEEGDKTTNCVIPGLGWLLCPLINTMANLTDGAYYIVGEFLKVQPILTTGSTAGLYNAWQVMRNIANVAFVIVFLVIIFSQVTSAGISNYGIKRLLPRLIVAAILVNVSYWICALAVDVSNITGSSLKGLLDAIAGQITIPTTSDYATGNGSGFAGIAGPILAWTGAGIAVYIALGALIPILLGALITIAGVFVTLVLRQALIVLLIAISPLAFVAYLLPNTENLFTQWRKLFQALLVLYPLIALLFGAGALASKIISAGAA